MRFPSKLAAAQRPRYWPNHRCHHFDFSPAILKLQVETNRLEFSGFRRPQLSLLSLPITEEHRTRNSPRDLARLPFPARSCRQRIARLYRNSVAVEIPVERIAGRSYPSWLLAPAPAGRRLPRAPNCRGATPGRLRRQPRTRNRPCSGSRQYGRSRGWTNRQFC